GVAAPAVDLSLSTNAVTPGGGTYAPLVPGVALDRYGRGAAAWTTPNVGTTAARVKASSANFAGVADVSDDTFTIQTPSNDYYINDGVLNASDVFTTAVGNDANGGTTPSTPMATLSALLARYDLEPGAVIHIDAGTYTL